VIQGNRDPNSTWAKARLLFSTQFVIRLGRLPSQFDTLKDNEDKVVTFIPDYWNKDKLSAINLSQVA
jgi:hypothetical protein